MSARPPARWFLGLTQLVGLVTAGWAVLAPGPEVLLRAWSSHTIYPAWSALVLGLGTVAAAVATTAPPAWRRSAAAAAAVSGVCAAQVAGLGVWAHQHWVPAFGMGGGYAGEPAQLERLAGLVAGGGALAALAAVAQLVVRSEWPRATSRVTRASRVATGVVLAVGVPLAVAGHSADLADRTSLGAFALVHGVPWGLSCAATGWASRAATLGVLGAAAVGAAAAAAAPSTALTYGEGGSVFATVAAVVLLAGVVEVLRPAGRAAPAR